MTTAAVSPAAPTSRAVALLRDTQHAVFTAMLVVGFVRSLTDTSTVPTVSVAIALAAWYAGGLALEHRHQGPFAVRVWLAGLTVLSLTALVISPDYAWVSFAVFLLYASVMSPAGAITAIAVFALTVGAVLSLRWPGDGHWAAQFIGPVMGAGVAAALVGVYRTAAAETAERQALIDDLIAARDELDRVSVEAGVRRERERLANEIHDTLAQGFASVVLLARRATKEAESPSLQLQSTLEQLEEVSREGLDEARRLVRDLPPSELDDVSLPSALVAVVSADADPSPVRFRVDGEPRSLDPATETVIFRVAQEALANARRHAAAQQITVTLTYQTDLVMLDVVDDGVGMSPGWADRSSGRFGMRGMRARVERAGGRFIVESTPGGGTAIAATMPAAPRAVEP